MMLCHIELSSNAWSRICAMTAAGELNRLGARSLVPVFAVVFWLAALITASSAQDNPADRSANAEATAEAPAPLDTFFKHSDTTKWWISGQANFIFQSHDTFYAAYTGPNSFTAPAK